MGYDLHITRRTDWPDDGSSITFDDWMAVASADPELRPDGYLDMGLPAGGTFRQPLFVWACHPHYGEAGGTPSLALIHGNVVSKNPDREFRCKMWRLAQALNAKVQGDDGEFYDCFGNPTPRAWTTQSYWLALLRHLGFKFIWGDPVGS